jgi:hypothetical protein
MKKKAILLLAMMAAALLVASGVALAATRVYCKVDVPCIGTLGDDEIRGTASNDNIKGLDGNDTIYGNSGNDSIYGGSGIDLVFGYSGNDFIYGSGGNDTISGGSGNDRIDGGSGDDQLWGTDGADRYVGWYGNDKMYDTQNSLSDAKYGDDTYLGLRGGGNDVIVDSGGAFDTLDLLHLTRSQVLITWHDLDGNSYLDALRVEQKGAINVTVLVRNYFDNSSQSGRGKGEMRIRFKDRTVGFPASEG